MSNNADVEEKANESFVQSLENIIGAAWTEALKWIMLFILAPFLFSLVFEKIDAANDNNEVLYYIIAGILIINIIIGFATLGITYLLYDEHIKINESSNIAKFYANWSQKGIFSLKVVIFALWCVFLYTCYQINYESTENKNTPGFKPLICVTLMFLIYNIFWQHGVDHYTQFIAIVNDELDTSDKLCSWYAILTNDDDDHCNSFLSSYIYSFMTFFNFTIYFLLHYVSLQNK